MIAPAPPSESGPATPKQIAERLYAAFARRDGNDMAACYAPRCTFSDPVFPDLRDGEVGAMWRMLVARAQGFSLTFEVTGGDARSAEVAWIARYLFSATGRKVENHVLTRLVVEDGLIVEQEDRFDLYRWTRMALGLLGTLLGWTPLLRRSLRKQARRGLGKWMAENSSG